MRVPEDAPFLRAAFSLRRRSSSDSRSSDMPPPHLHRPAGGLAYLRIPDGLPMHNPGQLRFRTVASRADGFREAISHQNRLFATTSSAPRFLRVSRCKLQVVATRLAAVASAISASSVSMLANSSVTLRAAATAKKPHFGKR